VNSNDEAAGETGGVAPRKKVKLRLLGPKIIDLTDSPAGRKRGREEEGGDGVDGEEDGSRHRKKAKIHHSRPSTLGHPEIIDLTESAPTTPAAPSIEQSTHLARETIEHRIHTPIFAPSWSPITPPPRPLPTTTARDVPNASYSPQAPPWSPITPPLPQNPTPPTAETLRDGLMPPERLLMLTYGEDGGQRDMEEWDELLAWVGFRGPCRLPGLKELGLDELYQLGDMERYRAIAAWQEEEARRREEQGRGEEVGNSSEAETQIPWEVVGGSVDFLGILL